MFTTRVDLGHNMTPEMDKELQESLGIAGLTITGDPESIRTWQYYALVGCFVQGWATLEYIFDLCLRIIFENAPEGRTLAKKLPTALAEKSGSLKTPTTKFSC